MPPESTQPTQPANSAQAPASTQPPNVVGGLEGSVISSPSPASPQASQTSAASANAAAQAPSARAPAQSAPASGPVFVGGRMFSSAQEALAFADQQLRQAQPAQPQVPQAQKDVDPADVLFEDPKAAIRILKDQIQNENDQRNAVAVHAKNTWDNFYNQNPDLKGNEDIVALEQHKNMAEIGKMDLSQSLPILAQKARARIQALRGVPTHSETLSSRPAVVAPQGGAPAPQVPAQAPSGPKTFIDEMKEWKAQRGQKTRTAS